ncbi:MAG: hypothetical protein IT335_04225 [Thermomicrobiales bacterium]|nr:hypothetical protein [Thermomicrobiales bacterium]
MPARNEVEKPEFELPDSGWHVARFEGTGEITPSRWERKYGPLKGMFPDQTYFEFALRDKTKVRSRYFDVDNPYAEIVVKVQNALAGREVGDDEPFDFGDYEGDVIEIFIVHNKRTQGANAGKTFADVTDARAKREKKAAPAPVVAQAADADDFPEDLGF